MKAYICRRGQADFVVDAPTIADAIIVFWLATGETPRPSYRVHHGRRRQAREVSAAVCYWRLGIEMRQSLSAVIEKTCTAERYREFCESVIQAGLLLGE